jgi:hypothetical protein
MKTLNIEDFAPHSFIVIFGDNDRTVQRVVESQTGSATTVILDDDNPFWTHDTAIQQSVQRGRYNKTSLIVRLSEPKELPTHIKYYIDYVILPKNVFVDSLEKRRLLYKVYGQNIPSFEDFTRTLDAHDIVIAQGRIFIITA